MGGGRDKRKKAKAKAGETSESGATKTSHKTILNEAKRERREAAIEDYEGESEEEEEEEEDIEILLKKAELAGLEKEKQIVPCERPTPRRNFTVTPHPLRDGELIMFGGESFNGKNTKCFNDLFLFRTKDQKWSQVSSPKPPPPRSQCTVTHCSNPNLVTVPP